MSEIVENKKPLHFVQLDALRFLAAFMVVFLHAFDGWSGWFGIPKKLATADGKSWSWFGGLVHQFVANMGFGVDLFFLISGFLITFLLIKEKTEKGKINIPAFFLRRILRIWPLYFFIIALCFFWFMPWVASDYTRLGLPLPAPNFKAAVFFYSNFSTIKTQAWDFPFAHFWSISIEEHFYLIWPFIVMLFPIKRLPVVLITIITGSMAFRAYSFFHLPESWFTLYLHTLSRIDALAIGGLAAWYFYHHGYKLRMPLLVRILLYGVIIWALCVDDLSDWSSIFLACFKKYVYLVLCGLAMMNFVFNPDAFWRWGPKHVFNYLGRCCFGIYLWGNILKQLILLKIFLAPNKPVVDWMTNHIGFGKTYWLIIIVFSFGIPILTYELIEKPFMKLKNRFAIIKTRG